MKRLAIVSIFDSEGVIYDYLVYFLEALNKVSCRMIIVANGILKEEGIRKLEQFTREIFVRENKGFDAGGYRFVFENIVSLYEIQKYDELILANDTCFGPFISFSDIFTKMERKKLDFWGMNFFDNNVFRYIQSDFLVFSKKVMQDVYAYFMDKISDCLMSKHEVCMQFERGLFQFLSEKKYKYGYYAKRNTYDPYAAPNYLIEKSDYPFLKKRAFEIHGLDYENNLIQSISLASILYNYNYKNILSYIECKFGFTLELQCNLCDLKEVRYGVADIYQHEIVSFCQRHREIYIYGTGFWGQDIYAYYKNIFKKFKGFIVSDDHYGVPFCLDHVIYKYSQIKELDAGIIVGLSKETSKEVKKNIGCAPNIMYLWK